jgi:large subunit ribosomal protein L24
MMKSKNVKTRLKVNDNVIIIQGADSGKRGKVLYIDQAGGRIVVEGINKKHKAMKPNQDNPKGGIMTIERPINISNVLFFCEKCKKGVRLSVTRTDKTKNRVCKKCGKSIS